MHEVIANSENLISYRLEVIGGWIVITLTIGFSNRDLHQVFVPDPNHEWKLKETNS